MSSEPSTTKKTPRTIENSKVVSEFLSDDSQTKLLSKIQETKLEKVLVTTSRRASKATMRFSEELADIFPTGEFVKRGSMDRVEDLIKDATASGYSHIALVGESQKTPTNFVLIGLPEGPSFYFRLSSIKTSRNIINKGRSSDYSPELILNNFDSKIGRIVGQMFVSLFPVPEFKGRQAVTIHNQRDFLFVRRHRYIFDENEKRGVRLQELGPQFTMKLKRITQGGYVPAGDECEYSELTLKKARKSQSGKQETSANNKVFAI